MVVGLTTTCAISTITTKVVRWNAVHGEMYLIQHYVIKVCQWLELLFKVAFNTITLTLDYSGYVPNRHWDEPILV